MPITSQGEDDSTAPHYSLVTAKRCQEANMSIMEHDGTVVEHDVVTSE